MLYKNISSGKKVPDQVNVIVEISGNGVPVKYELDKHSGVLFVDRFISTPMFYPCNYGFIPNTLSDDGDPIDILVISEFPIINGAVISAKPIGVLLMEDEKGIDEKILAVPTENMNSEYSKINEINGLSEIMLNKIKHFFEHYKDLEKNKWVKVTGYRNSIEAKMKINEAIERFHKKQS